MVLCKSVIIILSTCMYMLASSKDAGTEFSSAESNLQEAFANEDMDIDIQSEKDKYVLQKASEKFKETVDATRDPSEEELKTIIDEMTEEELVVPGESPDEQTVGGFEFPKLLKVDPGQVGDVVELELDDGVFYQRITKSIRPTVFEIPDFLTTEECDHIIEAAKNNGLDMSNLFGAEINDQLNDERNGSDISRISDQTWLGKPEIGDDFWFKLHNRLARLTQLDIGAIDRAEPMQVVSYVPGGHYHSHMDSVDASSLPCCFQTRCGDKEKTSLWSECCRLCRYITVLYYLSDVEAGGETAFPLADMSDELYWEKFTNLGEQQWYNLSLYCHNSSLVVTPKRGTAVFWYSHFIDEETGYLGAADHRSNHGGCDLIKGNKWIANNWISWTTYEDRFKPSIFYNP